MKIGVLGTGPVGQTMAAKLAELRHSVMVGTRNPTATLARTEKDMMGNPPLKVWHEQHKQVELGTLEQAAAHGELVINATNGQGSLEALTQAGEKHLAGKVLIDIANPLDFSKGMPPSLTVCNTDSLAEQIQRKFPSAKVVKTLNTMNCLLQVAPRQVGNGEHTVFLSGNDGPAKKNVRTLLEGFGWKDILDLGDLSTARGTEMILPLWTRIFAATQNPMFQFKVVR